MQRLPFLDTNILLRHLVQDYPDHSARATALISRIQSGVQQAWTKDTVILQTVYTLQRFYRLGRMEIASALLPLLHLHGIRLDGKQRLRRTFSLYLTLSGLSFADCYHIALVEHQDLPILVSFDRGLDRVATVTRVEPDAVGVI